MNCLVATLMKNMQLMIEGSLVKYENKNTYHENDELPLVDRDADLLLLVLVFLNIREHCDRH